MGKGWERKEHYFVPREEESSTFAAFMASFVMLAIFARETGSLLSYTELSCRGCGESMDHPTDTETETKGGTGRESSTEPSQTSQPPRLTSLLNCLTTSISRLTASSVFPPWTISRSPRSGSAITIWALFRIHRMFSTAHA